MIQQIHGNSTFSEETAALICEAIATSPSGLKSLCAKRTDLPPWQTIMAWLNRHPDFQDQYARAKRQQMDLFADEILEISDAPATDPTQVQRAKLQVETRKWLMSKLVPKKYGDRLDVTSGDEKLPIPQHQIEGRIESILMQAAMRRVAQVKLDHVPPEARNLLK